MDGDKRSKQRLYEQAKISYLVVGESKREQNISLDISSGGIRVYLNKFVPKEKKIRVFVTLASAELAFDALGTIKWISPSSGAYRYMAGVEFEDVDPATIKQIQDYINYVKHHR